MITGEIRNQVDRVLDAFWSGGISNPLEVIEQITYLLFLRLDDLHTLEGEQVWRHAPEAYFVEDAARIAASLSGETDREAEAVRRAAIQRADTA